MFCQGLPGITILVFIYNGLSDHDTCRSSSRKLIQVNSRPRMSTATARIAGTFMTTHGIRPKGTVIETVSFQMVLGLLNKTEMVAVVPRHIANHGVASGSLSIIGPDLKGGTLPIGVTYRGDRSLNPRAIRLAGFFEYIAISGAWDRRRRLA